MECLVDRPHRDILRALGHRETWNPPSVIKHVYMYVCIGLRPRISCPNYGVVGFQPHTAAIPDLDSG